MTSVGNGVLLESTVDGVTTALSLGASRLDAFTTVLAVEARVGEPFYRNKHRVSKAASREKACREKQLTDSDVLSDLQVRESTFSDCDDGSSAYIIETSSAKLTRPVAKRSQFNVPS